MVDMSGSTKGWINDAEREALFEARLDGIHPSCVTIDEEGPDYLPHMYGAAHSTLVSDRAKLPLKISDIYRKLTC